LIINNYK